MLMLNSDYLASQGKKECLVTYLHLVKTVLVT